MIFETKPTIVGHRGFGAGERAGYRENTLESYLAAVAHGLSWIELDVRRSLDGQLVIWHNPVCATRGPAHLSALVHQGVDKIVHKAFGA